MADFFDQICEVLAENGKKYPGNLTPTQSVSEFFTAIAPAAPPDPAQNQKTAAPIMPGNVNTACAPTDFSESRSLDALAQTIASCSKCRLCQDRHHIVFGEGNPNARLMFIGEAPGYEEDMQGRPFVGAAGQLLDKMIKAMRFTREEVYIANIIKCRPKDNRTPAPDEIASCIPFLHQQIRLVRPEVIVCLGATAAKALLNNPSGISKLRGKWCSFENIPVMPTFHPAFLLRKEEAKRDAWHDLQLVMSYFFSREKK